MTFNENLMMNIENIYAVFQTFANQQMSGFASNTVSLTIDGMVISSQI